MLFRSGHRLALTEKQIPLTGLNVAYRALLPKKAMSEIQKLASDDSSKQIEFSGNENHLFFRIDKRLLLSRKLTGNFPDYERVLPKEHPHTVVIARDELKAAIERVAQFADERSRAIRVRAGRTAAAARPARCGPRTIAQSGARRRPAPLRPA